MGPGLETALAQILGSALGLPADRFRGPPCRHRRHRERRGHLWLARHRHRGQCRAPRGRQADRRGAIARGGPAGRRGGRGALRARRAPRRRPPRDARRAGRRAAPRRRRLVRGAEDHLRGLRGGGGGGGRSRDGRGPSRRRVVGADVGRAVNPALVEAQLAGGAAFGIGNALLESLEYDGRASSSPGPCSTTPSRCHRRPALDAFYQEVPANTNPLGLRGVGECGNPGFGAASPTPSATRSAARSSRSPRCR